MANNYDGPREDTATQSEMSVSSPLTARMPWQPELEEVVLPLFISEKFKFIFLHLHYFL